MVRAMVTSRAARPHHRGSPGARGGGGGPPRVDGTMDISASRGGLGWGEHAGRGHAEKMSAGQHPVPRYSCSPASDAPQLLASPGVDVSGQFDG